MSILTLSSNNPHFSHIIAKNPNTILESKTPFKRKLRKGNLYGWFTKDDAQEFRILFRDSEIESSYGERGEFEYLDLHRYSHPYVPIGMMTEVLRTAVATENVLDTYEYQAKVSTVIPVSAGRLSKMNFGEGIKVTTSLVAGEKLNRVTVEAARVTDVLNVLQVICFLATVSDKSFYIPMGEEVITKYLTSIGKIDAGYFLRYLVLSQTVTSIGLFKKLEAAGLIHYKDMVFQFGNTQTQRHNAIKAEFKDSTSAQLIDIGCGELHHSLKLAGSYPAVLAYDADPEIVEANTGRIKKRAVENVTCINQFIDEAWVEQNLGIFDDSDVLASEVIEHMEPIDAISLVQALLKTDANKVIVTVPNKDFSVNYGIADDETRHEDHKWEPTSAEWVEFVNALDKTNWTVDLKNVGDSVAGVSVTLMATFTRKVEAKSIKE